MLTTLIMAGCFYNADPVRVSLNIDSSDLTLAIGESATRAASSEGADSHLTYSTDNPSVATVNQDGKVTARSIGEATITVHMDEDRKDWYAATDRTYRVIVKAPSAEQLRRIDRDTPLTLVAQEDGKITITFNNGITLSGDIIYTINDGAEQTISKTTKGSYDIALKKNDFVQLFSVNEALSSGIAAGARGTTRAVADGAKYINIKPAMKTEIYGNVMSMFKGENFEDDHEIDAAYALYGLFAGAEKLVNNSFRHIELPAYDLAEGCYQVMFYGCKGIQRAPDLPAATVLKNCYKEMFAGCSKLSYLKCQADDISAEGCTKDWLAGAGSEVTEVKTLVTAFDFPANSNDGVPAGWTNELLYPVKSVTLNKTSLEMTVGSAETGTAILTADVDPAYASDKTVFWLTSNKNVATVDDHGKVTAVGSGEAKITATAGGKTATCTVKVSVPVTGVAISGADAINAGSGYTGQLTATVTPANATDASVTWSSSAPEVLSVDANGKVTFVGVALAGADVTITATSNADNTVKDSKVISVSPQVGMVIGANGKAYNTVALANTYSTAAAIIAYKGNGEANSSYNTGLAISLADVSDAKRWKSEHNGYCTAQNSDFNTIKSDLNGLVHTATLVSTDHSGDGHDAALAADGYTSTTAKPEGCSKWFLPTIGQWKLMVEAMCGGTGLTYNSSQDIYKAAEFNKKIRAAYGVSEGTSCAGDVKTNSYWSSVENSDYYAWVMFFSDGDANILNKSSNTGYVRPVLAF